jgi:hypothetical protein
MHDNNRVPTQKLAWLQGSCVQTYCMADSCNRRLHGAEPDADMPWPPFASTVVLHCCC